ncbi:secondary thiamine-phosphate synthase enzyme YjbQ [Trichlorobacter sp.]|jgi:secondary thiamine-phosphate synthase enzyme|uniref:secondary thiamine-phosphate synthase enzyme YjbQ n=1 Tax=Trichlorobacter sp. TaxID=2911007 RepID=UPI002A35847D|nr:secondary thiamine-phosphate synthase enzyme YjbQ [Trichlorobacter sp.]MDY0384716.1 secondary thiamine-phosphate synthase enzyme YjbQ [Trichlorobacter sp.]
MTAELQLQTSRTTELLSVTSQVADLVRRNGWQDGVLTLFVPHTTAGITINENADPDVARDMLWFTEQLVPNLAGFRHAEGNSAAHIKASLFGSSVQVIVRGGSLWLGTWQGIYFCEFDGPRHRQLLLKFS